MRDVSIFEKSRHLVGNLTQAFPLEAFSRGSDEEFTSTARPHQFIYLIEEVPGHKNVSALRLGARCATSRVHYPMRSMLDHVTAVS